MMEHTEQLGLYSYTWDENCFPLGQDSMVLAEFCTLRPKWNVCDLGCGAGALMVLLLGRENSLALTGVEVDPHAAAFARRNVPDAAILTGDLSDRAVLPPAGGHHLVISNPPYFRVGSGGDGGMARMEDTCTVETLCISAAYLLKNGGRFALVYRSERLCDLLCTLRAHALEPKRMKLLAAPGKTPYAVLVEAVRQGKPGLKIEA